MDPSALIFVALAVAWAVYLLPKALKHHDSVQRGRSVERFSHRMRVLARREPTSSRDARLVIQPGRAPSRPVIETKGPAPVVASVAARRAAANRAARRRRNVLSVILLGLVVVVALAAAGVFSWWSVTAPAGLLAAWLVACRLMVKSERRSTPVVRRVPAAPAAAEDDGPTQAHPVVTAELSDSSVTLPAVDVELAPDDPSRWDMVPVTLPTYVTKPAVARRTVQSFDLESTGVWTSGHSEAESALARTAQEIKKAEQQAADEAAHRRAVGS
ncbi:hypothetical protein [Nocardioides daphniae]|uniref:Uncharacterized protein n=1 Tax=Nocardioides daphniae TaxID=402297 RepID=A0A4V1CWQ8_9ACTN|nr:hypothetical protein [Nocardioides daphniae]QCC78117.1 hypothetical protein E2C04_14690 [Nocardioides daphniae]GGD21841.1 hypothetical protein GCM10007231_21240 [Nocardioides daphniae]